MTIDSVTSLHPINRCPHNDVFTALFPHARNIIWLQQPQFFNGNESVPIQLAQCRFPGLAISNAKILIGLYFSRKINGRNHFHQTALENLLWFEITKMLLAVRNKYCVIYYNFPKIVVPCDRWHFVRTDFDILFALLNKFRLFTQRISDSRSISQRFQSRIQ